MIIIIIKIIIITIIILIIIIIRTLNEETKQWVRSRESWLQH